MASRTARPLCEPKPSIEEEAYRLIVDGLIENEQPWTLEHLYALPQETEITRLICIEGWSAIGKWTGTPLSYFLERIGADTCAKYAHFTCSEGYFQLHRHGERPASADADDVQV